MFKNILIVSAIAVTVLAIGSTFFFRARGQQERQTALSTGIAAALEFKKSADWQNVVKALDQPLAALGSEPNLSRELAESLLTQAKDELAKRSSSDLKLKDAQRLLSEMKFDEAVQAFGAAKRLWPESPNSTEIEGGIATAKIRMDFTGFLQQGKTCYEQSDWQGAMDALNRAAKDWPDSPQAAELTTLVARAKAASDREIEVRVAAERERALKAEAARALEDAARAKGELAWERQWPLRAKGIAKEKCDAIPAVTLLRMTHPTGKTPEVSVVESITDSKNVQVTIRFNWNGGIFGTSYSTEITWTFNKDSHIGANITADNGAFNVSDERLQELDRFFEERIYPVVKAAADSH